MKGYEGPRELDPQCAPDEVDTVMSCECMVCWHEWLHPDKPSQCPNCGESDPDWIVCIEVPA